MCKGNLYDEYDAFLDEHHDEDLSVLPKMGTDLLKESHAVSITDKKHRKMWRKRRLIDRIDVKCFTNGFAYAFWRVVWFFEKRFTNTCRQLYVHLVSKSVYKQWAEAYGDQTEENKALIRKLRDVKGNLIGPGVYFKKVSEAMKSDKVISGCWGR